MRALVSVYRNVRLTARALVKRAITCSCTNTSPKKRRMSDGSNSQSYKLKEVPILEPSGSKEESISEPFVSKKGSLLEACKSSEEQLRQISVLNEELTPELYGLKQDSSPEADKEKCMLNEPAKEIVSNKSESDENIQISKETSGEPEVLSSHEIEKDKSSESLPEIGIVKFNSKSKKWSTSVEIPKEMRRYVIGAKGRKKRKLEEETDCRLIFPSKGKKMRPINIVSTKSQESVEQCRDRIESLIVGARKKAPYTHFVSLPMNHPDIQESFTKFVDTIQNDEELSDSCREPALFQQPKKLHLTVVMLSLLDDDDMQLAAETLEQVISNHVRKILDGKQLEIEVKGLQCMNDDPSKVRVLYANAFSEKLDEIMNTIADAMGDTELAPRRAKTVKIHLTLMNIRYSWKKRKQRMDVEKLLEKYGDYDFGKIIVPTVHISSLMGPKDEDGYYSHIAKCTL